MWCTAPGRWARIRPRVNWWRGASRTERYELNKRFTPFNICVLWHLTWVATNLAQSQCRAGDRRVESAWCHQSEHLPGRHGRLSCCQWSLRYVFCGSQASELFFFFIFGSLFHGPFDWQPSLVFGRSEPVLVSSLYHWERMLRLNARDWSRVLEGVLGSDLGSVGWSMQ